MKIYRWVITLLIMCLTFASGICQVSAYTGVDSWFSDELSEANNLNIIPSCLEDADMSKAVTRSEFCETALAAYDLFKDKCTVSSTDYFSDTTNPNILMAYEVGIVKGYDDGTFRPENKITRQEMFEMIDNLLGALGYDDSIKADEADSILSGYQDHMSVQGWAKIASASLLDMGVAKGTSSNTIDPLSSTSRAQAIVLTYRSINKVVQTNGKGSSDVSSQGIPDGLAVIPEHSPEITGKAIGVDNSETQEGVSEGTFKPNDDDDTDSADDSEIAGVAGNLTYPSGFNSDFRTNSKLTAITYNTDKYILIFGSKNADKYASAAEAESHMVSVSVPVWVLKSDGTKVASTKTIEVNKAIEDLTKQIFQEIFNSDEKFPINSLGGYSWRGDSSNSSHKWGIAFDINPTQNYYISSCGTIYSGSHWLPKEDPLSIPEDSELIKIFAKYGFAWGGNAWTSSKDYMHFCYFAN